jgi:hypothetical protein
MTKGSNPALVIIIYFISLLFVIYSSAKIHLYILVSLTISIAVQQFQCSSQADIFFLLDASDGITQSNFKNELLFASNISAKLDLNDVHIGAAAFGGSTVQLLFKLGQFSAQAQLSQVTIIWQLCIRRCVDLL